MSDDTNTATGPDTRLSQFTAAVEAHDGTAAATVLDEIRKDDPALARRLRDDLIDAGLRTAEDAR